MMDELEAFPAIPKVRCKQRFTIWSINVTKDQGKEGSLHRKNMIHLMTCYMNRTVYMARARL